MSPLRVSLWIAFARVATRLRGALWQRAWYRRARGGHWELHDIGAMHRAVRAMPGLATPDALDPAAAPEWMPALRCARAPERARHGAGPWLLRCEDYSR